MTDYNFHWCSFFLFDFSCNFPPITPFTFSTGALRHQPLPEIPSTVSPPSKDNGFFISKQNLISYADQNICFTTKVHFTLLRVSQSPFPPRLHLVKAASWFHHYLHPTFTPQEPPPSFTCQKSGHAQWLDKPSCEGKKMVKHSTASVSVPLLISSLLFGTELSTIFKAKILQAQALTFFLFLWYWGSQGPLSWYNLLRAVTV